MRIYRFLNYLLNMFKYISVDFGVGAALTTWRNAEIAVSRQEFEVRYPAVP
jgi:hypothetical protein